MSSTEILESLNKTDKLVSGEGFVWETYLPTSEGFDYLYRLCKSVSTVLMNGEYDKWLLKLLDECDKGSESEIIIYQKQLYFSIIKNSSFSSKLCTDYYPDLVNRFVNKFKGGPLKIVLSAYDFIPFQYSNSDSLFKIFQVLQWRIEALRRYKVVCEFERGYSREIDLFIHMNKKNDFFWRLTGKQINSLVRELCRYFDRNSDLNQICEILLNSGDASGNIVWLGSTEALAYLFHKLLLGGHINNIYWPSIISRNMMFISKRGTIITNYNLNMSLNRIISKKSSEINSSKELIRVDAAIANLTRIKSARSYLRNKNV